MVFNEHSRKLISRGRNIVLIGLDLITRCTMYLIIMVLFVLKTFQVSTRNESNLGTNTLCYEMVTFVCQLIAVRSPGCLRTR